MKRGFTLIEVSYVLAVMAVLAGITVPTYQLLVVRAHADEAHAMLSTIAHAQLRHHRDHGAFVDCPAEGDVPKTQVPFPSERACWKALGLEAEGVRFRYGTAPADGSFTVTAAADLDGDGTPSDYRLDGRTLAVAVQNGLE